jgi:hypothetical protein
MTLSEDDLRHCLFAVIEQRAALHRGKFIGPAPRPDELIRKLFSELAELSRPRHSERRDLPDLQHDRWLTSQEVAERIGWNVRRVQRRAPELGGELISGRLLFSAATIDEHLEGAA